VYGEPVKKFKSAAFGVQVYVFANRMQIKRLPSELDALFKEAKPGDIFHIFDFYKMINNQQGLDNCKRHVRNLPLST
jgi:hypothetical protein